MKWTYVTRKLALRLSAFDRMCLTGTHEVVTADNLALGINKVHVQCNGALNVALHEAIKRDNKARRTVTT